MKKLIIILITCFFTCLLTTIEIKTENRGVEAGLCNYTNKFCEKHFQSLAEGDNLFIHLNYVGGGTPSTFFDSNQFRFLGCSGPNYDYFCKFNILKKIQSAKIIFSDTQNHQIILTLTAS